MECLTQTFSFNIFMDYYFTSFRLLIHLGVNKILATSVLNKNRLHKCTIILTDILTVLFYGKIYRIGDAFGFFFANIIDYKEYNGDALHSGNRLFMCLNSKFDESKQFYFKRF